MSGFRDIATQFFTSVSDERAAEIADEIAAIVGVHKAVMGASSPPRAMTALREIEKSLKRLKAFANAADLGSPPEANARKRWLAKAGEGNRSAVERLLSDVEVASAGLARALKDEDVSDVDWAADLIGDLAYLYRRCSGRAVTVGTDMTGVQFVQSPGIRFIEACLAAAGHPLTTDTIGTHLKRLRARAKSGD